jgi:hypothetical protein
VVRPELVAPIPTKSQVESQALSRPSSEVSKVAFIGAQGDRERLMGQEPDHASGRQSRRSFKQDTPGQGERLGSRASVDQDSRGRERGRPKMHRGAGRLDPDVVLDNDQATPGPPRERRQSWQVLASSRVEDDGRPGREPGRLVGDERPLGRCVNDQLREVGRVERPGEMLRDLGDLRPGGPVSVVEPPLVPMQDGPGRRRRGRVEFAVRRESIEQVGLRGLADHASRTDRSDLN